MKEVSLIAIGKLKSKHFQDLETDYLKRIKSFKVNIIETKHFDDDREKEGKLVLEQIQSLEKKKGKCFCIVLTEKGEELATHAFSSKFFSWLLQNQHLVFIFGGSSGHGQEVLKRADSTLSLSKLTFPHKIARLLLIEQIYRAETIQQGHPYSK